MSEILEHNLEKLINNLEANKFQQTFRLESINKNSSILRT